MNKLLHLFWAVVLLAGTTSVALFISQGGFGGGHGRFDLPLFILGLPWCVVPWPELIARHDWLWLVLLPFAINVSLLLAVTLLRRWRLARKCADGRRTDEAGECRSPTARSPGTGPAAKS